MRRWASSLLLLVSLPAAAAVLDQPHPNELMPVLVADPRAVRSGISYYRIEDRNVEDLSLGHSWGIARRRLGPTQDWQVESDFDALVYARAHVTGGINELEAADLYASLPVTARRGDVSFQAALFHKDSHLGDDYVRRTGNPGFRYSTEGLKFLAAIEPRPFARFYGGASALVHAAPTLFPWALQYGTELTLPDLKLWKSLPTHPYGAADFSFHEDVQWNMDARLRAGLRFAADAPQARATRLELGWSDGHSAFGQFYARREHHWDVALALEL